ncbi:hypothetical protein B0A55_00419 [Friedmanniomyces simplex]|uniref:Uncharacterized protein n=1 Tax=Friedmanniomyces simplex TaxID=329884 RepID=A0A4U0XZT8_9PEZI|nr:hypothetical protein B0A55_00419 [Friedmanniomyces simplex]
MSSSSSICGRARWVLAGGVMGSAMSSGATSHGRSAPLGRPSSGGLPPRMSSLAVGEPKASCSKLQQRVIDTNLITHIRLANFGFPGFKYVATSQRFLELDRLIVVTIILWPRNQIEDAL